MILFCLYQTIDQILIDSSRIVCRGEIEYYAKKRNQLFTRTDVLDILNALSIYELFVIRDNAFTASFGYLVFPAG